MYHDTIKINFNNYSDSIAFDYNFLISKSEKEKFSPVKYADLLSKFEDIGFNTKYLRFNDVDEDDNVFCTYNYQPNYQIFFSAYKKILENKDFHITFEYGVIINGKFYPNNMNFFAGIWFSKNALLGDNTDIIIKGKLHKKSMELYQIVDKDGNVIASEIADEKNNFEQHFFEKYDVKVALRKYKLSRLNKLNL